MAAINIQELRRIKVLSGKNVNQWKGECIAANAANDAGDPQPLARAGRGCTAAIELDRALENVLNWATGWPAFNGFGIMAPLIMGDVPGAPICIQEGCAKKQHARGLCNFHYQAVMRKRKPRAECVTGRKNHAYNERDICIWCKVGRHVSR